MAAQREPERGCLLVDRDGDVWRWNGTEWVCLSEAGNGSWDDLVFFGPYQIFAPQTEDGAGTPPATPIGPPVAAGGELADVSATPVGAGEPASSSSTGSGPDKTGGQPGPESPVHDATRAAPRVFELFRHRDPSGVSGTGVVAYGVEFLDGSVALRWPGQHPSTAAWGSIADMLAVHGHGGATVVRWLSTTIPVDGFAAADGELKPDWWHITDPTPPTLLGHCMATSPTGEFIRVAAHWAGEKPTYHVCRMDTEHAGDHLCCACDHTWPRASKGDDRG